MREVYLLRHAEKQGADGVLTEKGEEMARNLGKLLPHFVRVVASDSSRTQLTANLLTGVDPEVDLRAGYTTLASPEVSKAINDVALEQGITFLEAMQQFDEPELAAGVAAKAHELNQLIGELLADLGDDEKALIVSHDLTISPAMADRGVPLQSIEFLHGYVIDDSGEVKATDF